MLLRLGALLPRCRLQLQCSPTTLRRSAIFAPASVRLLCNVQPTEIANAARLQPQPQPDQVGKRFAVVNVSGAQYKVSVDDLFCVEKLDAPVGSTLALPRVLLVGEAQATVIGSPLIADAAVHVTVEEQGYAKKVIAFKKRAKKGWKKWKGSRARLTLLRVNKIDLPATIDLSNG